MALISLVTPPAAACSTLLPDFGSMKLILTLPAVLMGTLMLCGCRPEPGTTINSAPNISNEELARMDAESAQARQAAIKDSK